jgi:helicase SWR1
MSKRTQDLATTHANGSVDSATAPGASKRRRLADPVLDTPVELLASGRRTSGRHRPVEDASRQATQQQQAPGTPGGRQQRRAAAAAKESLSTPKRAPAKPKEKTPKATPKKTPSRRNGRRRSVKVEEVEEEEPEEEEGREEEEAPEEEVEGDDEEEVQVEEEAEPVSLTPLEEKKQELAKLISDNDSRVRLLFHLKQFVSLVFYDPAEAKQDQSSVWEQVSMRESIIGTRTRLTQFQQNYDLWTKYLERKTGGHMRSTRRQIRSKQGALEDDFVIKLKEEMTAVEEEEEEELVEEEEEEEEEEEQEEDEEQEQQEEEEEEQEEEVTSRRGSRRSAPTKAKGKSKTASKTSKSKSKASSKSKSKSKGKGQARASKLSKSRRYVNAVDSSSEEESDYDPNKPYDVSKEVWEPIDTGWLLPDSEDEYYHFDDKFAQHMFPNGVKLKLNVSLKPPRVTHPAHLLLDVAEGQTPDNRERLEGFMSSFKLLDEEMTLEEYEEHYERELETLDKINEMKREGVLQGLADEEEGESLTVAEIRRGFNDPERSTRPTHWDHVVAQACHFAKLMADERKAHVSQAKRLAAAVDQHFRRLEGAEERDKKAQAKLLKTMARKMAQDVMRRWKLAEKVVLKKKEQEAKEEERKQGKKKLKEILENSAQLLEARVRGDNDTPETEEGEKEEVEAVSDDAMSDVDMEDDREQVEVDTRDDDELTVEELRAKYAALDNIKVERAEEEDEEDEENGDDEDEDEEEDDAEIEEETETTTPALETPIDTPAEEDEFSSDTDITLDSEDESSSEQESDYEAETTAPGLAALMGGPKAIEEDEEEDDAFVIKEEEEEVEVEDDEEEEKADTEVDRKVETVSEAVGEAVEEIKSNGVESKPTSNGVDVTELDRVTPERAPAVEPPFLLRGTLRAYQQLGLEWLAGLYNNDTNGILADEMGLGKTIQTISLLSYLACEHHIWGPHLIIVPTSVMLNWEMEFKRFAPGFKVMTYYGNPVQRREKRRGWNKEDTWHVCITSYQLVLQDLFAFRRKRWHYMILDEAHNIKNFRSQRWQSLLHFNTVRRLLLTGTPLQNNLMELWSLLYFLMPSSRNQMDMPGFANLKDFQEWFSRPIDKMVEGGVDEEAKTTVSKLHQILRPYLLRRLKKDVEKQMPAKYEHVVYCRLSKRQRYLYDDFMSRAQTRETLKTGNFLSIINCLMQLRKVCNHPDLFEVRPIVTSFVQEQSVITPYERVSDRVKSLLVNTVDGGYAPSEVSLSFLGFNAELEDMSTHEATSFRKYHNVQTVKNRIRELEKFCPAETPEEERYNDIEGHYKHMHHASFQQVIGSLKRVEYLHQIALAKKPVYGRNLVEVCTINTSRLQPDRPEETNESSYHWQLTHLRHPTVQECANNMAPYIERFACITPKAVTLNMAELSLGGIGPILQQRYFKQVTPKKSQRVVVGPPAAIADPFHQAQVKLSIAFPDKRLLQYDCGKLQRLATLLQDLIAGGHRALIFTQMTKVLDVLEQFLNIHGLRYMRLDGATKIEQRQLLTERFNTDPKIPVFILSTRSGGLGINLTGADTVIFYDSDWNPSMDKQCQDRCHRIGQTRDVHIYRFVSEHTIESNILKKANQKQILDNVVIQDGEFTTDYFNKMSVHDMLGLEPDDDAAPVADTLNLSGKNLERALAQAEDADDAAAAKVATKETNLDVEDFDETQKENNKGATPGSRSTSATPMEKENTGELSSAMDSPTPVATPDVAVDNGGGDDDDSDSDESDSGIGHIDEYMIKFIEDGWFW